VGDAAGVERAASGNGAGLRERAYDPETCHGAARGRRRPVGDTAVDVAKEAADFVLLKQDLGVLRDGIL
jgi:hypothetical protein